MNSVLSGLVLLLTFVAVSKATFEQKIPKPDWTEQYGVGCEPDLPKNEDPSQIPPGSLDINGSELALFFNVKISDAW